MRNVVLAVGISLDGYIARPDGAFDFLFMPKDFSMAEFFRSVDALIMGRKTYDVSRAEGREIFGSMTTYVYSRTQPAGERDGIHWVRESPKSLVAKIRRRRGKTIWLMGGGEMAREFLKADLVDELHLGIVPVLIGEGIPLFPSGFPQRDFVLVACESFSKGLVSLKYKKAPARRKTKG